MSLSELWLPLRRLLAHHLARLREHVDVLGERVREALANTVGKSVAGAVRDLVERLLAVPGVAHHQRYYDPWDDERTAWDGNDEPWHRDAPGANDEYFDERRYSSQDKLRLGRWQRALAISLQAASWLLRRQLTRVSLASALGLGLIATAAAVARGPTVLTLGASIVAAVLGLLNLVDAATVAVDLAS